MQMLILFGLALTAAEGGSEWKLEKQKNGIKVHSRPKVGSDFWEFKSQALVGVPPTKVWEAITDYSNYTEILPYAKTTNIVHSENGGRVVHLYALTNPPIIKKRDYTLRFSDDSDWQGGAGTYKLSWKTSERGPEPIKKAIRITTYEGIWILKSSHDGKYTDVTYQLFTDPGGSLPVWVVNKLAGGGLLSMMNTIRERVGAPDEPERD